MRILFTFTGGSGHFLPALPIARAAAARGHAVLFSGQEAMLGAVRAAGFSFLPSGGPTLADPAARGPLVPVDRIHEEQAIRDTFAGRTARDRTARLLDVAARWSSSATRSISAPPWRLNDSGSRTPRSSCWQRVGSFVRT